MGIDCMDISALSGLSALETLELSFRFSEETREQLEQQGREYDISALSGLTSLKELKLNGYSSIYMDLNHLANLTNLVTLEVNEISTVYGDGLQVNHYGMDFSGLSGLKNLNKLVLDNVSINQVASIPALENLSTLEIQYNTGYWGHTLPLWFERHSICVLSAQSDKPGSQRRVCL